MNDGKNAIFDAQFGSSENGAQIIRLALNTRIKELLLTASDLAKLSPADDAFCAGVADAIASRKKGGKHEAAESQSERRNQESLRPVLFRGNRKAAIDTAVIALGRPELAKELRKTGYAEYEVEEDTK
jgi:hypothetical protein